MIDAGRLQRWDLGFSVMGVTASSFLNTERMRINALKPVFAIIYHQPGGNSILHRLIEGSGLRWTLLKYIDNPQTWHGQFPDVCSFARNSLPFALQCSDSEFHPWSLSWNVSASLEGDQIGLCWSWGSWIVLFPGETRDRRANISVNKELIIFLLPFSLTFSPFRFT